MENKELHYYQKRYIALTLGAYSDSEKVKQALVNIGGLPETVESAIQLAQEVMDTAETELEEFIANDIRKSVNTILKGAK